MAQKALKCNDRHQHKQNSTSLLFNLVARTPHVNLHHVPRRLFQLCIHRKTGSSDEFQKNILPFRSMCYKCLWCPVECKSLKYYSELNSLNSCRTTEKTASERWLEENRQGSHNHGWLARMQCARMSVENEKGGPKPDAGCDLRMQTVLSKIIFEKRAQALSLKV